LPLGRYAARRDSDRDGDDQKSRQMVGPDIDRIEVKRERQHHHRVLGARSKSDDDVGDRERKQPRHDHDKHRRHRHRHRERAERCAEVTEQHARAGIGKAGADQRSQRDHRGAADPPGQRGMNESGAVQNG